MSRLVLLDCEAVQALVDPGHRKHRRVLNHVQAVVSRKRHSTIELLVPTAVRVEAGWDRTSPAWGFANRLRIADIPLDTARANTAAAVRRTTAVSVADAHLGAAIQSASPDALITVVTSDPRDMAAVAGDRDITIVAI